MAEYPPLSSTDDRDFYFWQLAHGRPLLNGAPPGTRAHDATLVLLNPREPGAAPQLAFLGVRAIVTHPGFLPVGGRSALDAVWRRSYALVTRDSGGSSLWRVVAPPAPALVTLPNGFGEPNRNRGDGIVHHPLSSASGVGYIELTARTPGVVRLRFEAQPPPGQSRVLRVADQQVERPFALDGRGTVSVLVRVPRGRSLVLVKTDPAETDEEKAVLLSAPRTERVSGSPELHAMPVSSDRRS